MDTIPLVWARLTAHSMLDAHEPMALLERLLALAVMLALIALIWRARRLAERVDGLRKTMAEAIIHDLKNPMTSVMGGISCVLQEELTSEQRTRLLTIALAGCRAQLALLETLVDTGRLEHGELDLRLDTVRTRDLLSRCLDDVRGSAAHLSIRLIEDLPASLPAHITIDPDLFPRAVLNLLHNALKYTPKGGTVSLSTAFSDGMFRFKISDTGIGIPPESISRLFQKYYRIEGTEQTSRRGSGLGLYFCRMVVEAHGGEISISSGAPDGTTVSFNIPSPAPL